MDLDREKLVGVRRFELPAPASRIQIVNVNCLTYIVTHRRRHMTRRERYNADIVRLRREFPEVGWTSFEEWANVQDWQQMLF